MAILHLEVAQPVRTRIVDPITTEKIVHGTAINYLISIFMSKHNRWTTHRKTPE